MGVKSSAWNGFGYRKVNFAVIADHRSSFVCKQYGYIYTFDMRYIKTAKSHQSLLNKFSIGRQDSVQTIPLQAILELEASSDRVDLGLTLTNKVVCPFLDQKLGNQDIARQTTDALIELPNRSWIQMAIFFRNFLVDEIDEGLVDVSNFLFISAPSVNGKTMFLGEEIFEEGHVRGIEGGVNHSLEADILIQPNGPAQAILRKSM